MNECKILNIEDGNCIFQEDGMLFTLAFTKRIKYFKLSSIIEIGNR